VHNEALNSSLSRRRVYKVVFFNQGKVYELFAERVDSSHLYGFV